MPAIMLLGWPGQRVPITVTGVASGEEGIYAARLANVLRQLRAATGWTREEAAERLDVSLTSLGRWERGDNAPKGYDLGRLYRGYAHVGAQWEWFFDPPEVIPEVNPVKTRLDELAQRVTSAADEAVGAVEDKRRRAARGLDGGHGR